MSSSKWSHGLIAYLTRNRSDSKNQHEHKKKKKRRWLFRRAESQSSLQNTKDMYESFGGPFGPDGIQSAFTISPYEDVSPNSFFTEKGVQKDIDYQRNKSPKQPISSKTPNLLTPPDNEFADIFNDFALPEDNTYRRPSLKNIFNVQNQGGAGVAAVTPSTRTSAKTSSSNITGLHGGDEQEEEEEEEEEESEEVDLANPYEQDSFHVKPPSGASKRTTPKTSGSSLQNSHHIPYSNNRRSLTEESAVPSAVYSEAYTDNRVKKHGRERHHHHLHPPYYYPHPAMYPPYMMPHPKYHGDKKGSGKIPHYGGHPEGYMMPPYGQGGYPPPPMPHMMYPSAGYNGPTGMPPYPGYYPFFPPFPPEEGGPKKAGGRKAGTNPKRQQDKKRRKSKEKAINYNYSEELTVESEEELCDQNDDALKGLDKFDLY